MENKTNNTSFIENVKDNLSIIIVISIGVLIMIITTWAPHLGFVLAVLMGTGVVFWIMCRSMRGC